MYNENFDEEDEDIHDEDYHNIDIHEYVKHKSYELVEWVVRRDYLGQLNKRDPVIFMKEFPPLSPSLSC